jgi:hypothetical protein
MPVLVICLLNLSPVAMAQRSGRGSWIRPEDAREPGRALCDEPTEVSAAEPEACERLYEPDARQHVLYLSVGGRRRGSPILARDSSSLCASSCLVSAIREALDRKRRISMLPSLHALTWSTLCVVLVTTGCATISKKTGVENRWRAPDIVLHEGMTTQQDVLTQLGPPSQIIALPAKTVFYYVFEETKGRLLFLVLYNQADTKVTYDRAVFFFTQDGILETYAFSKKEEP